MRRGHEESRWIVVPDFDDMFHRDALRNLRAIPPWIKTPTRWLSNDDYLALSFHLRGVLHGLLLEYARAQRQLRDSTLALTRRLGQRVTRRDLDSLAHAGFIAFSASKPASNLLAESLAERRGEENYYSGALNEMDDEDIPF